MVKEALLREISTSLPGVITNDGVRSVLIRLEMLGYTLEETDGPMLTYCIDRAAQHIRNFCNIEMVPTALYYVLADLVCGDFFHAKRQSGGLGTLNTDRALQVVQLGDTSLTFGQELSADEKLDLLIERLSENREMELVTFRKVRW